MIGLSRAVSTNPADVLANDALLQKVKAELPTALDSSHQSKLDKLNGYKGADFSSEFDSQQVGAHKDAVSLFERYAKGGDNPKLKDWAGKTLPALQHHLEMAQALNKK